MWILYKRDCLIYLLQTRFSVMLLLRLTYVDVSLKPFKVYFHDKAPG